MFAPGCDGSNTTEVGCRIHAKANFHDAQNLPCLRSFCAAASVRRPRPGEKVKAREHFLGPTVLT